MASSRINRPKTKFIFITGGVISSLGKGITTASLALLLSRRGYSVRMQKLDPYLNVDPGTMSPYQHGEVYVTSDGAETDLDLGHYERFSGIQCGKSSNYTTGRIYSAVIERERRGDYDGKTVQVIPHVTDEIREAIWSIAAEEPDIAIIEIGGTVGDIESLPFIEAIRQMRQDLGRGNSVSLHLTLVPYIKAAGELKTKPSQQSVAQLREIGLVPDMLVCRTERRLGREHREKLALFCNVDRSLVFEERDVAHTIYEVPLELAKQDMDTYILEHLALHVRAVDLSDWEEMCQRHISPPNGVVEIAVVGKYVQLRDAYKSIFEALDHAGIANGVRIKTRAVDAEKLEAEGGAALLAGVHGVLVPGGFGDRGIEGKIQAVQFAREKLYPFLGICLGMQCAVVEFSRNVCGYEGAHSSEFAPDTPHPVIHLMSEQEGVTELGGTMRLGGCECKVEKRSKAYQAYKEQTISERHRHRYEFNNDYREKLSKKGLKSTGVNPDKDLVEIVELPAHPWFVAAQFHPEFQSTPLQSHPLFRDFVKAARERRDTPPELSLES